MVDDFLLGVADSIKFLGMYLDRGLTWDDHIENDCSKVASGMYFLRNLAQFCSANIQNSHLKNRSRCHERSQSVKSKNTNPSRLSSDPSMCWYRQRYVEKAHKFTFLCSYSSKYFPTRRFGVNWLLSKVDDAPSSHISKEEIQ
ncbi:hypothetical protein J6590_017160 [Homalodisca vitripennis]|nr:hypothetical protein J6590_017160 [Homalodisca vitripennis]